MQVLLLLGASLLAFTSAERTYTLSSTSHPFLPDTDYTDVCSKCEDNLPYIVHPYSCRIMVHCDVTSGRAFLYECVLKTDMWSAPSYCSNYNNGIYKPNCGSYGIDNNPCDAGLRPIPGGKHCGDYYECVINTETGTKTLQSMTCPDGQAFDYTNGGCVDDPSCSSDLVTLAMPKRINASCSEVPGKGNYQNLKEWYIKNGVEVMAEYDRECPANMVYDEQKMGGEFCCSLANTVVAKCSPNNLVRGWSEDDSWDKAKSGHKTSFSKMEGDAIIIRDPNIPFNGWIYFDGTTGLSAKKMSNNELRYYWNLTLTFQAGEIDINGNINVGIQQEINPKVALIDNSACDIFPSYGCHLMVEGINRGYVECFANNHTVRTNTLDLTKSHTVTLKRERVQGTMIVVPRNSSPIVVTFDFNDGEVILGKECSMTIGKGVGQRSYIGFMDRVMFWKNCA